MSKGRGLVILLVAMVILILIFAFWEWGKETPGTSTPSPASAPSARVPRTSPPGLAQPPRTAAPKEDSVPPSPPSPQTSAPPSPTPTSFAIEVVDESGKPIPEATVRIQWADARSASVSGARAVARLLFRMIPVKAGHPLQSGDLPKEADGLHLTTFGFAEGLPPFSPVDFTIHEGQVESVRLVAAQPRAANVLVVDASTDDPVAGARVASATASDLRAALELPPLDPALTGADGRCRLEGLGAGEQDLEIHATGYRRGRATWSEGELRVRLEKQSGNCTVTVKVLGPNGIPVPNIPVWLVGTDRTVKTDATGTVVFTGVAPGHASVSLDESDWEAAARAGKWPKGNFRDMTDTRTVDGEQYELTLGILPPGTGSIDAHLVDEDGNPIRNAKAEVFDVGNAELEAKTDAGGHVRFSPLPKGEYLAVIELGPNASWYLDSTKIADGENASVRWTLGTRTVRGRLIKGTDKVGVSGATIWFRGKLSGTTETGPEGRFELPRVPVGTYEVDASSGNFAVVDTTVTVPGSGDIVIEMVELGRIGIHFAAYDREKLRNAKVWLYEAGESIESVCRFKPGTGEEDLFADGLAPGKYEVEVTVDEKEIRFPVEVKSGKTSVLEIHAP